MNLTWNICKVLIWVRNFKGMDIGWEILYLLAIYVKRIWCLGGIKAKHELTGYCNFKKGKSKCIVLRSRKSSFPVFCIVLTTSRLWDNDTLKNVQRLTAKMIWELGGGEGGNLWSIVKIIGYASPRKEKSGRQYDGYCSEPLSYGWDTLCLSYMKVDFYGHRRNSYEGRNLYLKYLSIYHRTPSAKLRKA